MLYARENRGNFTKTMSKIKDFLKKIYDAFLGLGSRLIIRLGTRVAFRIKFYFHDRKIQGRRLKETVMIISNHVNYKDGAVIGITFPASRIYSLTAKDLFEQNKAKKWVMEQSRCIPIDRSGNAGTEWLKTSVQYLKEGKPITMFPEGESTYGGEMLPFKPGFISIAYRAQVPILPVYIEGPYSKFVGKRQRIIVGTPTRLTPTERLNGQYLESEAKRFEDIVKSLRDEMHTKMKKDVKNKK